MNWTKTSAIAEILSSIAVVITLIYLTIQIQQTTVAIQGNTRESMLTADLGILQNWVEHPEIWISLFEPNLSDEQRIQLLGFLLQFMRSRESYWLQYQNNVIDETTWRSYANPMPNILSLERSRMWWEGMTVGEFDDGFVAYVNETLSDIPVQNNVTISEFSRLE